MLQKHLDQQEEIGLIRKCDKHLIKRFGKAMHAYEPATADRGHRLRPLLHPQDVNQFAIFDGEMSLESTAEHMHAIEAESAAIAHDFTAGFWQGELTEEVQVYYGFEDQFGQCWVYCRMVMGCKILPHLRFYRKQYPSALSRYSMVESSHSCTAFPAQFHGEPIRRALRGIASRGVLFFFSAFRILILYLHFLFYFYMFSL